MSAFKVVAFAFATVWCLATNAFAADGWIVRKTSGEVWTGQGAQPVSLGPETVLKPGDTVTTGRNGRVLLVRGQETILISPNSVVGIPAEKKDGLATTITQQAGSILLEVEKKNVPHFEVETPYLAAVVKGTQFRVSVTTTGTRVDVQRGQVEVVDFKTGQIGQVLPGQAAQSFAHGSQGLSLSGSGTFLPVEHGAPRNSTLEQIKVPKGGLKAPQGVERGRLREAGERAHARGLKAANESRGMHGPRPGVVRIGTALGEVRINFHKVTHGLARSVGTTAESGRRLSNREATIWSSETNASVSGASGIAIGNVATSSGGGGGASAGSAASAAAVAAGARGNGNETGNGGGNGNAGGNGNNGIGNGKVAGSGGNGNGNGNANGGNGNGNGNGNGGNGNGNGNGGVGNGNGNGKGNAKH